MYVPSNAPIMPDQGTDYARHEICSQERVGAMRRTSANGRAQLFKTLISPQDVTDTFGIGAGVNTQKLQNQTEVSRGTATLGTGGVDEGGRGPTVAQVVSGAPEVVPYSKRGGGCRTAVAPYTPSPESPEVPGMPHRAPNIVPTSVGPMYFRGAESTIPDAYPDPVPHPVSPSTRYVAPSNVPTVYAEILPANGGLAGLSPAWGDAWVLKDSGVPQPGGVWGWIGNNPWLALAIAGAGVYALSRRSGR
jgi:hypothetical protein